MRDLRQVTLCFLLFFLFWGAQRILAYLRLRRVVAVHPSKTGNRRLHLKEPLNRDPIFIIYMSVILLGYHFFLGGFCHRYSGAMNLDSPSKSTIHLCTHPFIHLSYVFPISNLCNAFISLNQHT